MMQQAILINMPIDMFWDDDPEYYNIYYKAYIQSIENKYTEINTISWLNGVYVQRAVLSALDGKKHKYPDKPLERTRPNSELSPQEQHAEMINLHKQLKSWSAGFKK